MCRFCDKPNCGAPPHLLLPPPPSRTTRPLSSAQTLFDSVLQLEELRKARDSAAGIIDMPGYIDLAPEKRQLLEMALRTLGSLEQELHASLQKCLWGFFEYAFYSAVVICIENGYFQLPSSPSMLESD